MSYSVEGLSERVKLLITEKKEKRADVVTGTGISMTRLSNIITGNAENVGVKTIVALARYFDVTTDYLLGLSDTMSANADKKHPLASAAEYTGLDMVNIQSMHDLSITGYKPTYASRTSLNKDMTVIMIAYTQAKDAE